MRLYLFPLLRESLQWWSPAQHQSHYPNLVHSHQETEAVTIVPNAPKHIYSNTVARFVFPVPLKLGISNNPYLSVGFILRLSNLHDFC